MTTKATKRQARIKRVRLRRQMKAANEQLILSSLRQHELTAASEHLNEGLKTEIAEHKLTEGVLRRVQAQLADRAEQLEILVQLRTLKLTQSNELLKKEVAQREHTEILLRQQAEKLQETVGELEAFSYGITHDLRAPLRSLQSFSTILEEDCGEQLDETAKDYLRRISTSAIRMDKLIQDTLAYSRVLRQELQLEIVDVKQLLWGMLESYPTFQEPNARVIIEDRLPSVLGNEAALTHCFSNLLHNAIKFMAPGIKPHIRISAERRNERVRFWVADNGIGIDAKYFAQIFGMFQRLDVSFEGTGIGLTIVRKAAERMGGQVGLESEPGHGSRFWLDLKSADQGATIE